MLQSLANAHEQQFLSHCRSQFLTWLRMQVLPLTPSALEAGYKLLDGMNSYERELLYGQMDDTSLCAYAARCLEHATATHRRPASTYDDAIIGDFAPLLIDRLRKAAGIRSALYSPPVREESWK